MAGAEERARKAGDVRAWLRGLDVFAGPLPSFDPEESPDDPVELFVTWLERAVQDGVPEPHAMTLSTVDAEGRPWARVLILKNLDAAGWQFAVHGLSPKGRQLADRPQAALTFHWPRQGRQVRVRGPVTAEPAERSAEDFLARSPGARAEALLGRQSGPVGDLAERDAAMARSLGRVEREPGLVAEEWTLYTLAPVEVEFWQADPGRNHTRLSFARTPTGWERRLLWP
ncbi:pyridoxal 5'-phosphate synthase [Streptomyces sp. NPDC088729]|uniref:pyridoxine/pyridoxamine 5'-phosphate oxidase n=1 Tax=Streptomyces sp. NPDC088729 TaxID=3365876 RepID=UPI0037FC1A44